MLIPAARPGEGREEHRQRDEPRWYTGVDVKDRCPSRMSGPKKVRRRSWGGSVERRQFGPGAVGHLDDRFFPLWLPLGVGNEVPVLVPGDGCGGKVVYAG